jgi:hypothetical protein
LGWRERRLKKHRLKKPLLKNPRQRANNEWGPTR